MTQFESFTETEIIKRIISGEKSLYEIIVRRHNAYLYKIGRSYNYSHEDTQDLMQETFIDAYKNLLQFEGRSGFKTWIIRIMMHNCYRKREKSSFKNEVMQDVNDHSKPMFTHTSSSNTEKMVQNRELGHIIEKSLAQIPFDYRMVFALREINGLHVSETASLLNISEENVKVRLNRAKIMLRKELEKSYAAGELFEFNAIYCHTMTKKVMCAINKL